MDADPREDLIIIEFWEFEGEGGKGRGEGRASLRGLHPGGGSAARGACFALRAAPNVSNMISLLLGLAFWQLKRVCKKVCRISQRIFRLLELAEAGLGALRTCRKEGAGIQHLCVSAREHE